MTTVRQSLNRGNPNSIAVGINMIGLGEAISLIPRTVRGAVASHVLVLPEDARAAKILSAYAMGTVSGWKTPLADGSNTAPATTEVSIRGDGNIVFAAADAITAALVVYLAAEGEVFEETIDIAANLGTLLGSRRALRILSATRVTGTATGASTPVHRPATPTAGQVAIRGADDSQVEFPAADAVTRATIRYLAIPGIGTTTRKTVGENLTLTPGMV